MIDGQLFYFGQNLSFLQDALFRIEADFPEKNILFRSSELSSLSKIVEFGTDRGGFPVKKKWRHNLEYQCDYFHEDVLIATTEKDVREAEASGESHSFKKFKVEDDPLLLIYDEDCFEQICHKQYLFKNPDDKKSALLAVYEVKMIPEIEGWFSLNDGLAYQKLFHENKPAKMVEVGVWKGLSLSFVLNESERLNCELYAVDHFKGSADQFNEAYQELLKDHDIKQDFRDFAGLSRQINLIDQTSLKAAEIFADKSLDMIFLDASHDYESVIQDLERWFPKLQPGGILAGHDFTDKFPGLIRAVEEFAFLNKLEVKRAGSSIWYY